MMMMIVIIMIVMMMMTMMMMMMMMMLYKGANIFNGRRSNSKQNGAALTLSGHFPAPHTPFVPLGKSVFTRGQKKTCSGQGVDLSRG